VELCWDKVLDILSLSGEELGVASGMVLLICWCPLFNEINGFLVWVELSRILILLKLLKLFIKSFAFILRFFLHPFLVLTVVRTTDPFLDAYGVVMGFSLHQKLIRF
jgi:hypothetical protein